MEKIRLRDLEFYGYHGVSQEERKLGQKLAVHLEMTADLEKACQSDRIEDTVDYTRVYAGVKAIIEGSERFYLLEHMAEQIAKYILTEFRPVLEVIVTVCKQSVPYPGIGSCELEIRRKR
ncbi:MAG: dihydroneopterin aldolase [Candidatus Wallbacteria bacterium]|nr:dihydroneopterin aldolase [Candidatus Wallbacteria bacterium]